MSGKPRGEQCYLTLQVKDNTEQYIFNYKKTPLSVVLIRQ